MTLLKTLTQTKSKRRGHILLGITGSIAAYKSIDVVKLLIAQHIQVSCIFSIHALELVAPLAFKTFGAIVVGSDFLQANPLAHLELVQDTDAIVIAPATANVIAKLAHGIADDLLTTTVLASNKLKILFPAMNTAMWENSITQANIERLRHQGFLVVEPMIGQLACKTIGKGKFPAPAYVVEAILAETQTKRPLLGKRVLVTAGPTTEWIDPVRVITNQSSGEMGLMFARCCRDMGATVTLISSRIPLEPMYGITVFSFETSIELMSRMKKTIEAVDILFMAAAVSDFIPTDIHENKIKSAESLTLELKHNIDILATFSTEKRKDQLFIGFALETTSLEKNAKGKLKEKNLDAVIANSPANIAATEGVVTLFTQDFKPKTYQGNKAYLAKKVIRNLIKKLL